MEEPKRPNANYKLSKEKPNPIEEENLAFYYNRKHRLDKAPKTVKNLYEQPPHKFNLLRPLIADKPRAAIFFTIVIMCVMIFMLSIMGFFDKTHSLDGNKLEIKAFAYEGVTVISLKKTINDKNFYTGKVDIGISPVTGNNEDAPVIFYHSVYFTMNETEETRFTAPFASSKLAIALHTEKSELRLVINSE